jgi:hypothetical protein
MVIKILSAPGPVVFPVLAGDNQEYEINFGKEGKSQIILDSSVSLIKRKIPIDMVLLKGLSIVSPDFGRKTVIMRKGGASDVISQIIIKKDKMNTELLYAENMEAIEQAISEGKADSAVIMSSSNFKGITLEQRALKSGIYVPGSCGASMDKMYEEKFKNLYKDGLEKFRENPQETAINVQNKLPNKFPIEFIVGIMTKMETVLEKPEDYTELKEAILNA